jgi:uncharacterized protein YvpB
MPMLPEQYVIPQWGSTANLRRTDCGCASVAMMLSYYGLLGSLTVDDLVRETTLVARDNGLVPQQLVDLSRKHGLDTYVNDWTSLSEIRHEIDQGRPVICLVAYRFITNRLDQGDKTPGLDGHFLVIVGYDDTHFVGDDPDYWYPYVGKGNNTLINISDLDQALDGTNYYRRCVFVKEKHVATQTEIDKLRAQANTALLASKALLDTINALVPQVDPGSISSVPTSPTQKVMWTTDGVNVRSSPGVTATNKVGAIIKGTQITVKLPKVGDWYQILSAPDPTLNNGYVSGQYLSDGG